MASYAEGRGAGSGSTSDTKTLSISGMVLWNKIIHGLGQQRRNANAKGTESMPKRTLKSLKLFPRCQTSNLNGS